MKLAYIILNQPRTVRVHWILRIMPDGATWRADASSGQGARDVMARMVRAWRKAQRTWQVEQANEAIPIATLTAMQTWLNRNEK